MLILQCMQIHYTSAFSSIESVTDVEYKLIPDMIKICDWLKTNKFGLNALEPEFMIIGTNQNVHKSSDFIAILYVLMVRSSGQ